MMYCIFTVPGTPVQNIRIVNDTDDPVISVVFTWDLPSDPNGIIRYYRVEFQQIADGSGGQGRRKRVAALDTQPIDAFANFTGSGKAPTNITVVGLSTLLVILNCYLIILCSVNMFCVLSSRLPDVQILSICCYFCW